MADESEKVVTRKQVNRLDDAESTELLQCALFIDLYRGDKSVSLHGYPATMSLRGTHPYMHRIIPCRTKDPTEFINHLCSSQYAKDDFEALKAAHGRDRDFIKKLFWVWEDSDGLLRESELALSDYEAEQRMKDRIHQIKKAIAEAVASRSTGDIPVLNEERNRLLKTDLRTDQDYGNYKLTALDIKFEGTNISTARKDVTVNMTFELESFASMNTIMNPMEEDVNNQIQLQELITLPITGDPAGGPGYMLKNQYSPNYSRVRLKAGPTMSDDSARGVRGTDLIIDLSIIDHKITRDSELGKLTLEINYRGYFESMMTTPFNDALATGAVIDQRLQRNEMLNIAASQDTCEPETIREILRVDQASLNEEARNLKFSSVIDRLLAPSSEAQSEGYMWYAGVNLDELKKTRGDILKGGKKVLAGMVKTSNVAGWQKTPNWRDSRYAAELRAGDDPDYTSWKAMPSQMMMDSDVAEWGDGNHVFFYFYLGDLMEVLLDCLYKDKYTPGYSKSRASHREHVKNLNMRFLVGDIQIPNPKNPNQVLTVNPTCIPISLQYFARWWNDAVVKKNLTYYPVGVMIRDLIERLVTNLLYEVCFSTMLPDETPPLLRCNYMSSTRSDFISAVGWRGPSRSTAGFYFPTDMVVNYPILPKDKNVDMNQKIVSKSTGVRGVTVGVKEGGGTNYCVIYQGMPPFFREQRAATKTDLKSSPSVVTIHYGQKMYTHNFVSDVQFTKTDSPMLREARYFNNNNGNLSLLSNVYDLKFTIEDKKANVYFYPGMVINFILHDWSSRSYRPDPHDPTAPLVYVGEDSDPHTKGTAANVLGFGGYYIIKSVEYSLGEADGRYSIIIQTKFLGTDADTELRRRKEDQESIDVIREDKGCGPVYDNMLRHYEDLGGGEEDEEQFEHAYGDASTKITRRMPTAGSTTSRPSKETVRVKEGGGIPGAPKP